MYLSPSPLLAVCSGKGNGRENWYFCLKKGWIFADMSSFNDVQQSEAKSSGTTGYSRYVNGKAAILGKRITVAQILEDFAAGWNAEDYETEFDVPPEAVAEALRYAAKVVG